jgi:SAM-dependent methyltransferase
VKQRLDSLRRRRKPRAKKSYDDGRVGGRFVDILADEDLERLNELLPWHCFTVDSHGRPFGRPAWSGKRTEPEVLPDRRIALFHDRFDLSDKHVLEVGCFEGIHTIALCRLAEHVTAIDGRIENVVKTIVRCAMFDVHPDVLTYDLERAGDGAELLRADLCHHVGVLYHLTDPVRHLREIGEWIGTGLMLDTHYARPEEVNGEYEVDGTTHRFRHFPEADRTVPFAGMASHAKWLTLEDLVAVLETSGFADVEVAERRDERNGARALIFAERRAGPEGIA